MLTKDYFSEVYMLKQSAQSIAVMLRYARRSALLCLVLMLAQAVIVPLNIYLTGKLVSAEEEQKLWSTEMPPRRPVVPYSYGITADSTGPNGPA
jgi:hypothetical protein